MVQTFNCNKDESEYSRVCDLVKAFGTEYKKNDECKLDSEKIHERTFESNMLTVVSYRLTCGESEVSLMFNVYYVTSLDNKIDSTEVTAGSLDTLLNGVFSKVAGK